MVWRWLNFLLRGLSRLFSKPDPRDYARIDIDAACPVCGHRSGELKAHDVFRESLRTIACLHTCKVCGARWWEDAVTKVNETVIPSKDLTADPMFLSRAVTRGGDRVKEDTY